MPRQERDENAGKAVAGGERSVGAALDRGHFEEAGEPCAGAGDRRASDDEPPDRQALRERSAEIAARDPRREAESRPLEEEIERDAEQDADREAPMDVGARNFADHVGVAERLGRWLVGVRDVAQHALDEEVHDRDADVGQQQRRDRLVDAPRVAQEAGESDPEGADDHGEHRHDRECDERRRDADHRDRDSGGGKAAKHERALAADHDEAKTRGNRHRERGQDERRRALQRVLEREGRSEAASPDIVDEVDRRLADREEKKSEQRRRNRKRKHRDGDVFGVRAQLQQQCRTRAFRDPSPIRSREAPVAKGAFDIRLIRPVAIVKSSSPRPPRAGSPSCRGTGRDCRRSCRSRPCPSCCP